MHDQLDLLIDKIIRKQQRTVKAQVQIFGPWVFLGFGLLYWVITGKPPTGGP